MLSADDCSLITQSFACAELLPAHKMHPALQTAFSGLQGRSLRQTQQRRHYQEMWQTKAQADLKIRNPVLSGMHTGKSTLQLCYCCCFFDE